MRTVQGSAARGAVAAMRSALRPIPVVCSRGRCFFGRTEFDSRRRCAVSIDMGGDMSAASFDAPAADRTLGPAAYRDEDFPGCESFRLPASEIDGYEGRLEFWDGVTESATRRRQLYDSKVFFFSLSSAGTELGTCFGAGLRATSRDPVGNRSDEPWWSGRSEEVNAPKCAEISHFGTRNTQQPVNSTARQNIYPCGAMEPVESRPPRPPTARPGEDGLLQRGTLHATTAQFGSGTRDSAPWPSRIAGGNCRATWCRS